MSFQVNIPPSMVAKMAKNEEDAPIDGKRKREDWRKVKELEEARKAATMPPMLDEEGNDINPHIPQYIMQAPWYIGALRPTLKHQREQEDKMKMYSGFGAWYKKGVKEGSGVRKFKAGACENCGATTHKKNECFERPRKRGAKFTNIDIAPNDHLQPILNLSYESKRDRWNGYDPADYSKIVEDYQKAETLKREMKAARLDKSLMEGEDVIQDEEDDEDKDEDKYADDMSMPGTKFEHKERITVRNLRIREDTAKYLYNLDENSAYYDPKTRTMRDNPFKDSGINPKDLPFAGDNFVRWSGDAQDVAKTQVFAWEARKRGTDVHVLAEPTKMALLSKEFEKKKDAYKHNQRSELIERYGGQDHLNALPKELLLGQTENYVEYSRQGAVMKGLSKAVVRSRYEEDVLEKNHSRIWGSFWREGEWGYKCCHSTIRGSYCVGKAGLQANSEAFFDTNEDLKELGLDKSKDDDEDEDEKNRKSIINENSLLHTHLVKRMAEEREKEEEEIKKIKRKHKKDKKKKKKRKRSASSSSSSADEEEAEKEKTRKRKHRKDKKEKKRKRSSSSSSSSADDGEAEKEKKVQKAIKKEKARLKAMEAGAGDKGRPYNVTYDGKKVTEEDLEAFHRMRSRTDDPMGNMGGL